MWSSIILQWWRSRPLMRDNRQRPLTDQRKDIAAHRESSRKPSRVSLYPQHHQRHQRQLQEGENRDPRILNRKYPRIRIYLVGKKVNLPSRIILPPYHNLHHRHPLIMSNNQGCRSLTNPLISPLLQQQKLWVWMSWLPSWTLRFNKPWRLFFYRIFFLRGAGGYVYLRNRGV